MKVLKRSSQGPFWNRTVFVRRFWNRAVKPLVIAGQRPGHHWPLCASFFECNINQRQALQPNFQSPPMKRGRGSNHGYNRRNSAFDRMKWQRPQNFDSGSALCLCQCSVSDSWTLPTMLSFTTGVIFCRLPPTAGFVSIFRLPPTAGVVSSFRVPPTAGFARASFFGESSANNRDSIGWHGAKNHETTITKNA